MDNYRTSYKTRWERDRNSSISLLTEHLNNPPYRFHNRDMSALKAILNKILIIRNTEPR